MTRGGLRVGRVLWSSANVKVKVKVPSRAELLVCLVVVMVVVVWRCKGHRSLIRHD